MANRLIVEETPSGAVSVLLRREGQDFDEPFGEAIPFAPPLDTSTLKDLRWYLEDYLIAPYAVWEDSGGPGPRRTPGAGADRHRPHPDRRRPARAEPGGGG